MRDRGQPQPELEAVAGNGRPILSVLSAGGPGSRPRTATREPRRPANVNGG